MKLHFALIIFIYNVFGLPVTQKYGKNEPEASKSDFKNVLEYERYLKEVVEALESDPDFRKKLDKAPEVDIRTGRIAQELEYVNHNVRSKLDEIKRREIERLRSFASKQFELDQSINREHLKIPEHLDHHNIYSFEIEDLRKLILKTSKDLAEVDRKRREEFKQYEMQKEFEKQATLKELNEKDRKKYEEKVRRQWESHKQREKLHHPGNKAQLEEVWVKQDHMEDQEFNPKIFFMIHDIDGNGYWDETELKALFVKQLDKAYPKGTSEDDLRERAEDMERMREHVFQEVDTNSDGLISFQEFMEQTKREQFQTDSNWQTVDEIPQFTREEYLEFVQKREKEIQELISQGKIPPHPEISENKHSKMEYSNYSAQSNKNHSKDETLTSNLKYETHNSRTSTVVPNAMRKSNLENIHNIETASQKAPYQKESFASKNAVEFNTIKYNQKLNSINNKE